MANQTGVALTIADMAASAQSMSKYIRGSLTLLEHEYELSDILKFISLGGQQSATVPRPNPDAIGSVYYRNVDGKYTFTKNSLEKFTEETKMLSYAFQIDTVTNTDPSYQLFKPGPTNLQILSGQWARELMDAMVNGDPTVAYQTDPDGYALHRPPGLRYRLANQFNGIDANCKINSSNYGGVAVDLTNIGSAVANNLVDGINETIDLTGADFMLMNYRMKTLLMRATRVATMLKTTQDAYGRTMDNWDGRCKVIVPKLKTASRTERNTVDSTNWILPYEDATGATTPTALPGSQFGSIFFVRANTTDGFTGFTVNGVQQRGPEKLPLPQEAVAYSMQYGYGFGTLGFRSIAQLYDIKIG